MRSGRRPPLPAELPALVRRLVADCWAQRHSVRPPAQRVVDRLQAMAPPEPAAAPVAAAALLAPAALLAEAAGSTVRSFAALFAVQPGSGAAGAQPDRGPAVSSQAALPGGRAARGSGTLRYNVEL